MKKEGILIYDNSSRRMDVRFSLEDYYGGLHCGTTMDVLIDDEWVPTRIEFSHSAAANSGWYLIGLDTSLNIQGLKVRL